MVHALDVDSDRLAALEGIVFFQCRYFKLVVLLLLVFFLLSKGNVCVCIFLNIFSNNFFFYERF